MASTSRRGGAFILYINCNKRRVRGEGISVEQGRLVILQTVEYGAHECLANQAASIGHSVFLAEAFQRPLFPLVEQDGHAVFAGLLAFSVSRSGSHGERRIRNKNRVSDLWRRDYVRPYANIRCRLSIRKRSVWLVGTARRAPAPARTSR